MKRKFFVCKRLLKRSVISLFIILFPQLAKADSLGADSGFSLLNALNKLIQLLSGQVGGAICVLTIVSVGYAWLHAGRLEKSTAITSIVGVSVIFSAAWIANYLGFTQ